MVMRAQTADRSAGPRKVDLWPVHQAPSTVPASVEGDDSISVISDMVAVLSGKEHGSTAEALAFLRQLYPRYPLTLRLAAIVAHSKSPQFAMQRPVAQ